ncbi:MAG: aprataxin-like protein [Watsoniomyces obsoletus]|nr:MAG: aprataxin-like protein [Watsoniomyces obsoletus]
MPKKGGQPSSHRKEQPATSSSSSSAKKKFTKTNTSTIPSNPDEPQIIFTNDTTSDDKKTSKGKSVANGGGGKGSAGEAGGEDKKTSGDGVELKKQPDTRTLIGGASWTGKLPVNLLSEHCQRMKWGKADYSMRRSKDGYAASVILSTKNPKTGEIMTLPPLILPSSHQHLAFCSTAVEARHFAATYALFRVCSTRNLQMALPPTYRDLWKGVFPELKQLDVKEGRGWWYADDPFKAWKEHQEQSVAAEKARQEKLKSKSESTNSAKHEKPSGSAKSPKVDMGSGMRRQIESLIRRRVIWNSYHVQLSPAQKEKIVNSLTQLGFRKSHVREAVEYCKDREETMEWLLIHVPEDDLPGWSLPEMYRTGVTLAKGDVRREDAVKRLVAAGYATELCEDALDRSDGNEARAAEALQKVLVDGDLEIETKDERLGGDELVGSDSQVAAEDDNNGPDDWTEEQSVLEAIYGDRYNRLGPDLCQIALANPPKGHQRVSMQFHNPLSRRYPLAVPVLNIKSEPKQLPAHVRLAAIKQAVVYSESNLQGEQMVSSLIDWFEDNLSRIIEEPGPLLDVAPAATAVRTPRPTSTATNGSVYGPRKRAQPSPPDPYLVAKASIRMLSDWETKQTTPKQQKMLASRQSLPAWSMRDVLVQTVIHHRVTIISGETGSGKSTQSVQFIFDDMIQRRRGASSNIVCTQPRRISALGLADRVSEERCSVLGQEVGYAIRGESRQTRGVTRIKFVTTGVLLRQLQGSSSSSSRGGNSIEDDEMLSAALADVSHVVVDEVHERSLDTDLLLALLRRVLLRNRHLDLKVILMSATLDAEAFVRYFEDVGEVGQVKIKGRTYPVEDYYLDDVLRMTGSNFADEPEEETNSHVVQSQQMGDGPTQAVDTRLDYDLIAQTVSAIDEELGPQNSGGVLIFLPGIMEIERTLQAVRRVPGMHALPLHASLPPAEQRRVFQPPPKGTRRKIIAATNVAETSITIEDIVAVIDSGRVRETSFDPATNLVNLREVWASRAACKQRRGRAGRIQAGKCYKLYTREDECRKMKERPEPEIRRVPLEQLCLSVKGMGILDVPRFLADTITPPADLAVEGAIKMLRRMGALDGDEMTALGRHLAMIPADLRCGKLLVYGATFGCLESCLTIAAILTSGSGGIYLSSMSKRDEAKRVRSSYSNNGQGDLIADLRAYEDWFRMQSSMSFGKLRNWCDDRCLSYRTLQEISSNRTQYISSLKEAGFIPRTYLSPPSSASSSSSSSTPSGPFLRYNHHNHNDALLRAVIAGSFSPQIARISFPEQKFAPSISGAIEIDPEARMIKYFNQENGRVFVHPSSTMFDAQNYPGQAQFVSYFSKWATAKVYVRELTPFNAYTLLLFSSGPITVDPLSRNLQVDHWLRLRGWARIGVLVSRLRWLLDDVLASRIDDPNCGGDRDIDGEDEDEVVEVVRKLVELNGMDQ